MSGEHFKNMKNANLFDCLKLEQTRLVPTSLRHIHAGYSEAPLEFHLKPETVKKLSFKVPWGGTLYGFVHPKAAIKERLGLKSDITCVTVSDWDGRFVLIFETENEADAAAYNVSQNDVIKLLENCCKPIDF